MGMFVSSLFGSLRRLFVAVSRWEPAGRGREKFQCVLIARLVHSTETEYHWKKKTSTGTGALERVPPPTNRRSSQAVALKGGGKKTSTQ